MVFQLDKLIEKSTFEHKLSTFGDIVNQTCLNISGLNSIKPERNLRKVADSVKWKLPARWRKTLKSR